jgi:hypothetical protein
MYQYTISLFPEFNKNYTLTSTDKAIEILQDLNALHSARALILNRISEALTHWKISHASRDNKKVTVAIDSSKVVLESSFALSDILESHSINYTS